MPSGAIYSFLQGWWVNSEWYEACKWSLWRVCPLPGQHPSGLSAASWIKVWSGCSQPSNRSTIREQCFDRGLKCFGNSWLLIITRMRTLALIIHRCNESWNIEAEKDLRDHVVQPPHFSDQEAENKKEQNICLQSRSYMVSDLGSSYSPSHWADLRAVTENFQDKLTYAHICAHTCTCTHKHTQTKICWINEWPGTLDFGFPGLPFFTDSDISHIER